MTKSTKLRESKWRKSNAALVAYFAVRDVMNDALFDCSITDHESDVTVTLDGDTIEIDYLIPANQGNGLTKPLALFVSVPFAGIPRMLCNTKQGQSWKRQTTEVLQRHGYLVRFIDADLICFESMWHMFNEIDRSGDGIDTT